MEQLRPGAAHLADDHLALSGRKGHVRRAGTAPRVAGKGLLFSPQGALGEGETRLQLKMGLVCGDKAAVGTHLSASLGSRGHYYNLKYTLFWRQCFDTLGKRRHIFTKGQFVCHLMFSQRLIKL